MLSDTEEQTWGAKASSEGSQSFINTNTRSSTCCHHRVIMTSTRFSLVILGFVVTCAVGMRNLTTGGKQNITSGEYDATEPPMSRDDIVNSGDTNGSTVANSTFGPVLVITTINATSIPSTNSTNSTSSATNQTNITSKPSTTLKTDEVKPTTPKPSGITKIIPTTTKNRKVTSVKPNVAKAGSNRAGLIVLIVIIIIAAVFVAACCWTRRRGRRYSVDPTSRADDVNIPLSAGEPADPPADPVPHNGLQTFESAESASKEPEVKSEVQEEQKAEADKPAVKPSAESAAPAPAPSPGSSPDKPEEAAAEQSPPAPAGPEKTDDGGLVSSETSVESVTETNENNSNNAGETARDLKVTSVFWDVPLHSSV